jgi:hypothetical protein
MGSKLSKPVTPAVDAPVTLTTFPLFRNLPFEIRRMIWKRSLPGERFLEFVSMYEPGDWVVSFVHCKDKKIPHMSVCHESRSVAREEYVEFRPNVTGAPPMYVSPKLDVFCFAGRRMEGIEHCIFQARDQVPIKRVATQQGLGGELLQTIDCRTKLFPEYLDSRFTNFGDAGLWHLDLDEIIVISDEQELFYDDPGIVGFKDGWTGHMVEDFEWLGDLAAQCKEMVDTYPGWVAPVLRMGQWVIASPSEFSHDNDWLEKAWVSYGKGVWNGTIERREGDENDWEEYFGAEEERGSIFGCSRMRRDEIVEWPAASGLQLLASLAEF